MIKTSTQKVLNIKLVLMVCLYLGCLFLFKKADVSKMDVARYKVNSTIQPMLGQVELNQGLIDSFPHQEINYLEAVVSN